MLMLVTIAQVSSNNLQVIIIIIIIVIIIIIIIIITLLLLIIIMILYIYLFTRIIQKITFCLQQAKTFCCQQFCISQIFLWGRSTGLCGGSTGLSGGSTGPLCWWDSWSCCWTSWPWCQSNSLFGCNWCWYLFIHKLWYSWTYFTPTFLLLCLFRFD